MSAETDLGGYYNKLVGLMYDESAPAFQTNLPSTDTAEASTKERLFKEWARTGRTENAGLKIIINIGELAAEADNTLIYSDPKSDYKDVTVRLTYG